MPVRTKEACFGFGSQENPFIPKPLKDFERPTKRDNRMFANALKTFSSRTVLPVGGNWIISRLGDGVIIEGPIITETVDRYPGGFVIKRRLKRTDDTFKTWRDENDKNHGSGPIFSFLDLDKPLKFSDIEGFGTAGLKYLSRLEIRTLSAKINEAVRKTPRSQQAA